VSHELKTPITSIKGFVETLEDGAIRSPEDAERFLGIMAKQADRLNAIIEDLLALSRIEQEADSHDIRMETARLRPVLANAIDICTMKASDQQTDIRLECPPDLEARISPPLLEQAVVNLIDNAVKYSPAGSTVLVEAKRDAEALVVSVQDHGCGIEPEHLERLFERFYRVDKARSRKLGGTGLGLSIVKHIVQTHRGRVSVESVPGKGSVFRIHLPA
jgi:two-component system phosphate regulon sensor histidine kinase PhoR